MNSYRDFVTGFAKLFSAGTALSSESQPRRAKIKSSPQAPVVLIFSPHPDDECIIGGLPLRLLRESDARVINVAVTLGSDIKRRPARRRELQRACDTLGFELAYPAPNGLLDINPESRRKKPKVWAAAVKSIATLLSKHQPRAIFCPHGSDVHPTHIGTHLLVLDALKTLPKSFACNVIETEFWGQMTSPNLLVESSVTDVTDLVTALALHTGEVRRNPYHLRLPAWMQDNVRRGAELIGGKGSAAPDFLFGTLYRLRRWENGRFQKPVTGKCIDSNASVAKSLDISSR